MTFMVIYRIEGEVANEFAYIHGAFTNRVTINFIYRSHVTYFLPCKLYRILQVSLTGVTKSKRIGYDLRLSTQEGRLNGLIIILELLRVKL